MDPELAPMEHIVMPDYADFRAVRAWLADMRAQGFLAPPPAPDGLTIEDRRIPGLPGEPEVPVRIYKPQAPAPGVLIYLHSGSMIMGDLDMEQGVCLRYSQESGCTVIGVDYRLAPEHRFPAAIHDAYATLLWAARNAAGLGAPERRLAVCGHSSGGMLAAGVSIMARDRGGPLPSLQMMIYAPLDAQMTAPSMHQGLTFDMPSRAVIGHMWRYYLGEAGVTRSPYAAPAQATDLSGLPAAYVEVAAIDRLRDEAIAYATRLLQAGVAADLHVIAGAVHAFDTVPGPLTDQAYALRAMALRRAFRA